MFKMSPVLTESFWKVGQNGCIFNVLLKSSVGEYGVWFYGA